MKVKIKFSNFKKYKTCKYSSICYLDAEIETKQNLLFFSWSKVQNVTFTFYLTGGKVFHDQTVEGEYYIKYKSQIQKYILENNLV